MNDPNILVEELRPDSVVQKPKHAVPRNGEEVDLNTTRRLTQRYNISNDQAYDMLRLNPDRSIGLLWSSDRVKLRGSKIPHM
jgi:transcription initiation factor TFIID subunit 1